MADPTQTLLTALSEAPIDEVAARTGIPRRSLYSYREGRIAPPLRRAADICAALDLELVIRPRADPGADRNPAKSREFRRVSPGAGPRPGRPDPPPAPPATRPGALPGAGFEPVSDRDLATMLAALADEYEDADGRAREGLRIRFWHAYPELRERADRAAGRRLARLAGG